jgi:hypothetical protein
MSSRGPKKKNTVSYTNSEFEEMYFNLLKETMTPIELRRKIGKAEFVRYFEYIDSLTEEEKKAIITTYTAKEISELSPDELIERFEQLVVTKPKPFYKRLKNGKVEINKEVLETMTPDEQREAVSNLMRDCPEVAEMVRLQDQIDDLDAQAKKLWEDADNEVRASLNALESQPIRSKKGSGCSIS